MEGKTRVGVGEGLLLCFREGESDIFRAGE